MVFCSAQCLLACSVVHFVYVRPILQYLFGMSYLLNRFEIFLHSKNTVLYNIVFIIQLKIHTQQKSSTGRPLFSAAHFMQLLHLAVDKLTVRLVFNEDCQLAVVVSLSLLYICSYCDMIVWLPLLLSFYLQSFRYIW